MPNKQQPKKKPGDAYVIRRFREIIHERREEIQAELFALDQQLAEADRQIESLKMREFVENYLANEGA